MDIKIQENVEDRKKILSNMRLVKEGLTYYVFIPKFSEYTPKNREEAPKKIVSIDLGTNIYGTYMSTEGEWGEVGAGFKDKLYSIYKEKESIEKRMPTNHKKKRALINKERKVFNLVDDFQWKSAHWFLNSYKEILISRLYVKKAFGENKQCMNDAKFCRFVERLKYLSMSYKDRVIHEGREHYTSQHCTKCGTLNTTKPKDGSVIKCLAESCKFEVHRDLAGARNFLVKYLHCF